MSIRFTIFAATLIASHTAHSATVLGQGPQTPQQRINSGQQLVANATSSAVPEEALAQAARQRAGEFGPMARPTVPLGQIQKAWDSAGRDGGVHTQVKCETCVYRVRLREFMLTAITLPEGVKIENADVADTSRFDTRIRNENTLVIKPLAAGVDSSMQVYTADGEVYSFYLRAETVNSKHIPDLLFKIEAPRVPRSALIASANGAPLLPLANQPFPKVEGATSPQAGDFVQKANIDPSKLRGWGKYKLWGSDNSLMPEMVLRDDHFTYIFYGEKWNDLQLPTAYKVYDKLDELVNTRVSGSTYIIESTNKLITLKSGQTYMCIQYLGD